MTHSLVEPAEKDHLLSNRVYDILKVIVTLYLPALGTLYAALAAIWGIPYAEQVVGSIVAIVTFLGVVLKLGSSSYNSSQAKYDGFMDVDESDTKKSYHLTVNGDVDNLDQKDQLVFKVNKS